VPGWRAKSSSVEMALTAVFGVKNGWKFSPEIIHIIQPFLKLGLMLGGGKGDLKLSRI